MHVHTHVCTYKWSSSSVVLLSTLMSSSIVLQLIATSCSMVFLLTLRSSCIVPLLFLSGLFEQLLPAPQLPKSSHLGRRICLNSASKLEVELALKNGLFWGLLFSGDFVTVVTSVSINENINPRRGLFFYFDLEEESL